MSNIDQQVEQQAPLRITISEVKSLLDQGKSRKEIADYYGKTQAEMQRMVWSHPKLKNLKAKKQYTGIELEDDEEDAPVAEVENATDNALNQGPTVEESQSPGTDIAEENAPVTAEAEETWK
jgi:hypothetical protein